MRNGLKKATYNPPLTFWECFVNGQLDIGMYFVYCRKLEENEDTMRMDSQIYFDTQAKRKRNLLSMDSDCSKKPQKRRKSVKSHSLLN